MGWILSLVRWIVFSLLGPGCASNTSGGTPALRCLLSDQAGRLLLFSRVRPRSIGREQGQMDRHELHGMGSPLFNVGKASQGVTAHVLLSRQLYLKPVQVCLPYLILISTFCLARCQRSLQTVRIINLLIHSLNNNLPRDLFHVSSLQLSRQNVLF